MACLNRKFFLTNKFPLFYFNVSSVYSYQKISKLNHSHNLKLLLTNKFPLFYFNMSSTVLINIDIVYLSLYILELLSFRFKHNTDLWAGATLLARTPTRGVTEFLSRDVPYKRASYSSLDFSLLWARLTLSFSTFPDDGGRVFGRWKLGVENSNLAGIPRTSYWLFSCFVHCKRDLSPHLLVTNVNLVHALKSIKIHPKQEGRMST